MKRQTPIQTQKENKPPQMRGLLPHAAVRTTADHDMTPNVSAETNFGHDFSQIAVRSSGRIVSQDYSKASCPPFPHRYLFGGACPPQVQAKAYCQEPQVINNGHIRVSATKGTSSGGGRMPYGDRIQTAFGKHDISGIRAYQGPQVTEACREMRAAAYAHGEHVGFGHTPSLHTAAHEAAHVVQQRSGIQLAGGVGKAGDAYEKNADAVADALVSGGNAEALLDQFVSRQIQNRDGLKAAAPVQMEPVSGVAIAGLVVAIVAALTGAGALAYGVHAAQNNQRSGGTQQILGFGSGYFLTSLQQSYLRAFMEALIRKYLDDLDPGWETRDESDHLQAAKTRAEVEIQRALARKARVPITQLFWWGGDDTHGFGSGRFRHPGGIVYVNVYGDELTNTDFPGLTEAAGRHNFDVSSSVRYLERVALDGIGFTGEGVIEDDFCFVRPGEFHAGQAAGDISVTGVVYFDWDGNTTHMEWGTGNAISHNNIPEPSHRGGPPDT
jgi:hypothetical protein